MTYIGHAEFWPIVYHTEDKFLIKVDKKFTKITFCLLNQYVSLAMAFLKYKILVFTLVFFFFILCYIIVLPIVSTPLIDARHFSRCIPRWQQCTRPVYSVLKWQCVASIGSPRDGETMQECNWETVIKVLSPYKRKCPSRLDHQVLFYKSCRCKKKKKAWLLKLHYITIK